MIRQRFMLILIAAALVALASARVRAQLANLDQATFIEGLRQEGLRDLLKHLAETELGDQPILQKQVLIGQYLLDYEEHLGKGDLDAATLAFRQAVETTRQLIDDHADHEQRPIWQTQLAEQLLFEKLSALHRNAGAFYEFGVPARAQAEAFEDAAVTALELLEDADLTFFRLQSDLPKDADHTAKRIDTGLWERMINQFYNVRTQYSLARAAYYTALLPDSSGYYHKLGANPKIIRQEKTIAAERARLLALAVERAESLLTEKKAESWNIELRCRSLLGRALLAQGKTAEGTEQLRRAVQAGERDTDDLWAHLGLAAAQERSGDAAGAMLELSQQLAHPTVSANLLLRLLVVDAMHRLKLRAAEREPEERRAVATAEAYQPYLDLMSDPKLAAAAEQLRQYIYQRWAYSAGDEADVTQLPAIVVAAIGQTLRAQGQNLTLDADRADGDDAATLAAAATAKLTRAVQVNADLLRRQDLPPQARAEALYNQALANYFLDRADPQRQLATATALLDLADQFPKAPISVEALAAAVGGILRPLHDRPDRAEGVDAAYRRAARILFDKFPATAAAHDQRLYYATHILLPAAEHARAADVLAVLPADHADYFQARRERLYALLAVLAAAAESDRAPLAEALTRDAERLRFEADQTISTIADAAVIAVARNAAGHARLVLAELAGRDGRADDAIAILDTLDQDYRDDGELISAALSKRIVLRAGAEQFDEAAAEAQRMMTDFPDEAATVIDRVLTDLDRQADDLRQQAAVEVVTTKRQALTRRATAVATTAAALAQLLVDWADGQGFDDDRMLPYRLLLAKSKLLAGNAAEAVAYLEPLLAAYGDDAEVIHQSAEAYFALGTDAALTTAATLFSTLIQGLPLNDDGTYPPRYYNAWMRYLQISEKRNRQTADIALTIRQLQLAAPDLGGEPYKSELQRMLIKYAR